MLFEENSMYEPSFPPPVVPPPPVEKKTSGLGIAALIIGILAFLGVCVTFGFSAYSQSQPYRVQESLNSVVGLLAICTLVIGLVGVGLGVAGVLQKTQSKVMAIIGLVLSSLVLIGMCGIMLLGVAMISSF